MAGKIAAGETFDEYTCSARVLPTIIEKMRHLCDALGGVDKVLELYLSTLNEFSSKTAYALLYKTACELRAAFVDDVWLDKLLHCMHVIDTKRVDVPKLTQDQSTKQQLEILAMLDADKVAFTKQMQAALGELSSAPQIVYRQYYVAFCRLVFSFCAYQAPARSTVERAAFDAMEKTDLWPEFLISNSLL